MIDIRPERDGDHQHILEILLPIIRAGETYCLARDMPGDQLTHYWIEPPRRAFVAEVAGEIVGTYYIRPNQPGGGDHVCNCGYATHTAAQGRGVARAMLEHSLAEAASAGFRAMQFNFVVASNARAIALWQRYGFDVVGRLPGAFAHPLLGYVDALVMYRHLKGEGGDAEPGET